MQVNLKKRQTREIDFANNPGAPLHFSWPLGQIEMTWHRVVVWIRYELFSAFLVGLLAAVFSCNSQIGDPSRLDRIRLPTGLGLVANGDWLIVSNGNWDQQEDSSSVVMLDIQALDQGITQPLASDTKVSRQRPCRQDPRSSVIQCFSTALIDPSISIRIGSGAGNVVVDQPKGAESLPRIMIPTRIDRGVEWFDLEIAEDGRLAMNCGQGEDARCDRGHRVRGIENNPARLTLDRMGFRFAYLPHLLGRRLTLIALDSERGPEVVDVHDEFFREDPVHNSGLGGGFSVAQLPCDFDSDFVPEESRECTRPYLYASHRFWWGLSSFRIAPGRGVILKGRDYRVVGTNVGNAGPRPLMGDLQMEDPNRGNSLLVVHTTPPALVRVDTSLDEQRRPLNEVGSSVPICNNPNLLQVYRPEAGQGSPLALLTCVGVGELAIVDLLSFRMLATIPLGNGANEMAIDVARKRVYVANTVDDSVSIVTLDRSKPNFLQEIARIHSTE